jgi:hypothetical protein
MDFMGSVLPVLWQIAGGFVALLVIAGSIGELVWCSLYFSDPTNVSQPFTGIVHATAAAAAIALAAYHSRRRQRESAMRAGGRAALLETYGYDVRLGTWSIRVQWMFIFMIGIGALSTNDTSRMLPFVVIATLAVISHEIGHAAAAQRIRASDIHIELHAIGGLTTFTGVWLTRRQQAAVALAGPLAGIALGLLAMAVVRLFPNLARQPSYPDILLTTFGWSFLNLLPILPLDGAAILDAASGGKLNAFAVSCITAVVAIVVCACTHHLGVILIFIILLIANLAATPAVSTLLKRWDARVG